MALSVYCYCADFGGTEAEAGGKVIRRRTRMRTRAGMVSVWGCVYWLPVFGGLFNLNIAFNFAPSPWPFGTVTHFGSQ